MKKLTSYCLIAASCLISYFAGSRIGVESFKDGTSIKFSGKDLNCDGYADIVLYDKYGKPVNFYLSDEGSDRFISLDESLNRKGCEGIEKILYKREVEELFSAKTPK